MNLHVPQSEQARAEVALLMNVATQIVSPQNNGPCISLVQDSVLGLFLLTQPRTILERDLFDDCVMEVKYPEKSIISREERTGRALISFVVPPGLNAGPYVRDGEVVGVIDKRGAAKLVHVVFLDRGSQRCMQFISDLQRIITRYLSAKGFSVGLGDCLIDADGRPPPPSGSDFNDCGLYVRETISPRNAMLQMAEAGSKGALVNIVQITTCVGQQYVEGEAIEDGFVANSFIGGLSPREFFAHAQGGREGLVDTAVKTASTGYIQRRLVKLMESQRVCFDGTVRNSRQQIVQFHYNGDGLDATFLERAGDRVVPFDLRRLLLNHTGPSELPPNFKEKLCGLCDEILGPAAAGPQKEVVRLTPLHSVTSATALLADCGRRLRRAKIDAGTMVGALAATSLGEPCTQMCLNSFHLAGVGGKQKMTTGVPRFKELLNCTANISTPSMTLPGRDCLVRELYICDVARRAIGAAIPPRFREMHAVFHGTAKKKGGVLLEVSPGLCNGVTFWEVKKCFIRACGRPVVSTTASSDRWLFDVAEEEVIT